MNPAGVYVPPNRTLITPAEAVAGFRVACLTLWGTDKPETVATLCAQSALESARWHAMWNFNPSNIKHGNTRQGLYTCIKLNEKLKRDGKEVYVWFEPELGELVGKNGPAKYPEKSYTLGPGEPQCRMRAFEAFDDGVQDKLSFLNKPQWAGAKGAALEGKPDVYVHRCKVGGYFTADEAPYARGVVSLFKTFLPMAKTQQGEPLALAESEEELLCQDMATCLRFELPLWLRLRVEGQTALTADELYRDLEDERRAARDAAVRGS